MPETVVYRILRWVQKHAVVILVATILVTAVMGFFALRVKVQPGLENLIPEDEEVTRLIKKYAEGVGTSDVMILALEADDPFRPEALEAFAQAIEEITELPHMVALYHPFNLTSFRSRGKKLEVIPPLRKAPAGEEEIVLFREQLRTDPIGRELLTSKDGRILAALFGTLPMDNPEPEMRAFERIADGLKDHYAVYYSGLALATYKGILYVRRDLPKLLTITLGFILLIYYLGFRAFRAIVLPIVVVSFGTVWALGFMGVFGFDITVVSITTPPLVLILGSSYSIHVLNQYYREGTAQEMSGEWICRAVFGVNRTILMASATTVIGFMSLLATTTRQIRQFGVSTSVGIVSCALLSLFFLPAALSLMTPPKAEQSRKVLEGAIHRVMLRLSRAVLRFPAPILLAVAAVALGFGFSLRHIRHQYDYFAYFPPQEKLVRDTAYTARKLGGFQQLHVTVSAPEGQESYFLDSEILRRVDRFEAKLGSYPNVVSTLSFVSYLKHLNRMATGSAEVPDTRGLILLLSRYIKMLSGEESTGNNMVDFLANEDFSRLTIIFRVYNLAKDHYVFEDELRSLKTDIEADFEQILQPAVDAELWGNSLRYLSLSRKVNRDQWISMVISVVLIFSIATLSFRSPLYGLCSLFPLVTGVMINFVAMAVFNIPLDMTTIMVSSVAIGVGVDNSLHLLIQYRRQRKLYPHDTALIHTLTITGRPILLTTASIVGGVLVLAFASFRPILYFGVLVSLTLFATAVGSLVVLPVVLSLYQRLLGRASQTSSR